MRRVVFAVAIIFLLLHVATAQTWPKPATTSLNNETNYNGSTTGWAAGASPVWFPTSCSTQGVNCKIDTQGWWACDGSSTSLNNCAIEMPRPRNVATSDDGVSVRDLMYTGFNGGMYVNYNGWICSSTTNARPCGLPNLGFATGCDMMTICYADKMLTFLNKLGFTGPTLEWYGLPYGTAVESWSSGSCTGKHCRQNTSMQNAMQEMSKFPGMKAWIMIDNNDYVDCQNTPNATNCGGDCTLVGSSACTIEDKFAADIIYALTAGNKLIVNANGTMNSQYLTYAGNPVIASFGANCSTDWAGVKNAVLAKTGKNVSIWLSFRDGANPYATCPSVIDGVWGHWIAHPTLNSTTACGNYSKASNFPFSVTYNGESNICGLANSCGDQGTAMADCQAVKNTANDPTDGAMISIASHFDQRSTPWGSFFSGHAISLLSPQCGTTWMQNFTHINQNWSSGHQLFGAQVTTWDDYYENSAVEGGIENCWEFTDAHVTGNTLSWTITKTDEDGAGPQQASEADFATVDHFRLFVSGAAVTPADPTGKQLVQLDANVPKGTCIASSCTYSVDLTKYGLNSGTQLIYVKMVPKALMFTKMSNAVTWVNGNNPPIVSLSVTPSFGTVTVSVTATLNATDTDGTISSATLNWGDGTVDTVTGLTSKTHSYTVAGNYTVIYSATDNSGATSQITTTFLANGATTGKRRQAIVD